MAERFLWVWLALSSVSAWAGNILCTNADFTGTMQTGRVVLVYYLDAPTTTGTNIITRDRLRYTNDSSGFFTITNYYPGNYRFEFNGTYTVTTNWFEFPATNGTINAHDPQWGRGPTNGIVQALTVAAGNTRYLSLPTNNATGSDGQVASKTGDKTKWVAQGAGSGINVAAGNGGITVSTNGGGTLATISMSAVTNSGVTLLYANGTAWGTNGPVTTAGTTTSGLQEALDSLVQSAGLFTAPAGAGEIKLTRGVFNYSSQILLRNTALKPFNLTVRGQGWLNTILRDNITTAIDGIVTTYNPSFGSTNTLTVTFEDIGFTCSSNFVKYIMNLGGVSYAHFNRCMFAPDAALTYNPAGWTANIHENGLTNVQGVAAVKLQSAQNPGVFFNECVFLGLASGVRSAMDNIQFTRCVAVDVGGYYNGSSFVFTNLWTTKPECLGGAFIDEGSSGDFYVTDCQVGNVAAVIVEASGGAGLEGHLPKVKGGYFGDNQYTILSYGLRPVMLESVFEGNTGGDSLVTNNLSGRAFPAQVRPNNVHRFQFTGNNISLGTNNNVKFTTRGDGTNWGRFSALNGAAVFNATITTTSNLWIGRAGTASANKLYTRTNAIASDVGNHSWWTNAATGGFVVDDSFDGNYNQNDSTEVYDKDGNSLYFSALGIGDPASIELMFFAPSGGSGSAADILYFTYTDVLSSPNAILPQTTVTNLTASRTVLTDGSKNLVSATASGAVPIDADGTATTFAQVNALAPSFVLTNNEANSTVFSNKIAMDAAHSLSLSNATALTLAAFDGKQQVTNATIGSGLALSAGLVLSASGSGLDTTAWHNGGDAYTSASIGTTATVQDFVLKAANAEMLRLVGPNGYNVLFGGGALNPNVLSGGPGSVISGGESNLISASEGSQDVIAGGFHNRMTTSSGAQWTSILGGKDHQILGVNSSYSAILGGESNVVSGNYALATGRRAQALHDGAFVLTDSQNSIQSSTAADELTARFQNGYRFNGGGVTVAGGLTNTSTGGTTYNASKTPTNSSFAPDMRLGSTETNIGAAFTLSLPINVDSTLTFAQTTVFIVRTNGSGSSPFALTAPTGVKFTGTLFVTNTTIVSVYAYGKEFTNYNFNPIY